MLNQIFWNLKVGRERKEWGLFDWFVVWDTVSTR